MHIHPESTEPLLLAIGFLERESDVPHLSQSDSWHWYWPFGKKKNIQKNETKSFSLKYPEQLPVDGELPDELILGGVETLAGALLMILPMGPVQVVGGILVGDGLRRVFDGTKELSVENKTIHSGAQDRGMGRQFAD